MPGVAAAAAFGEPALRGDRQRPEDRDRETDRLTDQRRAPRPWRRGSRSRRRRREWPSRRGRRSCRGHGVPGRRSGLRARWAHGSLRRTLTHGAGDGEPCRREGTQQGVIRACWSDDLDGHRPAPAERDRAPRDGARRGARARARREARRQDLLPEVPAIERPAEDRLVGCCSSASVNAAGSRVYARFVYCSLAREPGDRERTTSRGRTRARAGGARGHHATPRRRARPRTREARRRESPTSRPKRRGRGSRSGCRTCRAAPDRRR